MSDTIIRAVRRAIDVINTTFLNLVRIWANSVGAFTFSVKSNYPMSAEEMENTVGEIILG